jgi:hypothetical protein
MKNCKNYLTLLILLLSTFAPVMTIFAQDEVPYGPWPDEIRFESGFEEPILYEKMKAGDMHLYIKDWTDVELLEEIKASPDLGSVFTMNSPLTL